MKLAIFVASGLNSGSVASHGDKASRIEVHVRSTCENQRELALLLRPLYRQGVLYIPSHDSLGALEGSFHLRLALSDESTILRARAHRVDPFAHGLTTGGYPGFALLLSDLDARGQEFVTELTRSMEGTLPFGIPSGALGVDRILCKVQLEELLETTMTAAQPITEVASTQVPGTDLAGGEITGIKLPGLGEDAPEATIIVGEATFAGMTEEEGEQTAVAPEQLVNALDDLEADLLASMSDIEEATAVVQGPPSGAGESSSPGAKQPPLAAPASIPMPMPVAIPLSAPLAMPDVRPASAPVPIPNTQPISEPVGMLHGAASNPISDEMPSSILFGQGDNESSSRLHSSTDFIKSVSSTNRPLLIASLSAVVLGLGAGYLIWGLGGSPSAAAENPSAEEKAGDSSASTDSASADPGPGETAETLPPADASTEVAAPRPTLAPEGSCQLSISTTPEGAALFYEGSFLGVSPYQGAIDCEAKVVEIRHSQFQASEARFDIVDEKGSAQIKLSRPRFWVFVNSVPRKAIIKRDGQFLGRTPMSLRLPGFEATSITIARKGFASQTVEIVPTEYKSTVKLQLQRKP